MDYTSMASHYDTIMTSGYYDYPAIAKQLARHGTAGSALEIGAGTGLILDELAERRPDLHLAGIDVTQAMLDIASERLWRHPGPGDGRGRGVELVRQNVVDLELAHQYDLAYSYGGVWYFVQDGDDWTMISHLREEHHNQQGLERVAAHLNPDGILLLGVQGPHTDYRKPIANDLTYAQQITPIADGFRKRYQLTRAGWPVMEQTTDYRTYSFADALDLLDKSGFEHHDGSDSNGSGGHEPGSPLFVEFSRR